MSIPTISGIAGILTEPEATATPQGTPILKLFIGMSDRKYNDQTQKWESPRSFAVEAIAWEDRAERFAQGLSKGDQVYIEGRLETQTWEDKNGGGNRSKPSLTLNVLRKLEKAPQQGSSAGNSAGPSAGPSAGWNAPAQDPWASSTAPAFGGQDDNQDPPF